MNDITTLNPNATYSYADYLKWKFEEHLELIRGRLFKMSPAPKTVHQQIISTLLVDIGSYLKRKKCQVLVAPFDVRLIDNAQSTEDEKIYTVVQPDISIICDTRKIDERGCLGAPDCIIEIVSKSTLQKDVNIKYNLYQENKVREYWIVFPNEKAVMVYDLDANGKYQPRKIEEDQRYVKINILEDFSVDLDEVFD